MTSYPSDSEVSSKEETDRRDKVGYWLRWIKRERKAAECHWQDADQAWAEYENAKSDKSSTTNKPTRCYPIYYTAAKFLESALYSKDPKPKAKRLFDIDDPGALTQELIVNRLGKHFLEISSFGEAMRASRDNLIHADKCSNQIIVDFDLEPGAKERRALMAQESEGSEPKYLDGESEYEGEVLLDDEGFFYEADGTPTRKNIKISVKALQYDEILHNGDAKTPSDVSEKAYFFCLSEEAARKRFPKVKIFPWRVSKSSRERGEDAQEDNLKAYTTHEKYLCGWEIYCLDSGMVYWVCEEYPDDFLDKKPIEEVSRFRKKFPSTKFFINSKPRKSLFPTPVFKQIEATTNQLHKQYKILMELADAARPRDVVLSQDPDLIAALQSLPHGRFIAAQNSADLLSKAGGDLRNLILTVPVDHIVSAMSQIVALEETFKNNMFEWFGTPEIVRGISAQSEKTKAEAELEHGASYDRFRYVKTQIEELARDTLEMGIDAMLDVYSDEEIARICGHRFMERGTVDPETGQMLSMGHYERFFQELQNLRNDDERLVRIDIETDSTSFTNEMKEMQKRQQIFSTVLEGLSTIGGMQNQQFMAPVTRAFLGVLEAIGGAVMEEDSIREAIKELEEVRNQPPPPPPPDYTELKVQAQIQGNQIKAQKDMMDNEVKHRELGRKEYEVMLKEREIAFDQQITAVQTQLEQALVDLEANRVAIEEFKAKTIADEAKLEEMRLALETVQGGQEEMEIPKPEPAAQMPQIVLVDSSKPQAGRIAMGEILERNPDGSMKSFVIRSAPQNE